MSTTEQLRAAKTILAQLGGNRFLVMTGCRGFIGDDTSLQFSIPRNPSKATHCRIALTPDDLYYVRFMRYDRKTLCYETVSEFPYAHAEDLRRIFTDTTTFYTSL